MYPRITERDDGMTVYVGGELDHHGAKKLREMTDSLIQQKKPHTLRLDFSGVTFMDSSGIGFIMGRYRMMKLYGGEVRVVAVPEGLRRMMELSGIGTLNVLEGSD